MFSSSRRLLALAAAVFIAVLTSIAVGLLSPKTPCTVRPATTAADAGPIASAAQSAAAAGSATCKRSAFATGPALVSLVGVLLGAGVVVLGGAASGSRRAGAPARPGSGRVAEPNGRSSAGGANRSTDPAGRTGAAPTPAADGASRGAEADRGVLVQACIYVRDRLTSKALADRLGAALREAGVEPLEPHGEPFDAAQHEAGGTLATNDPAKVGRIAAVEVPGYADRGRPLRVPIVTVYQAAAGGRLEQEAR